MAVKVVSVCYLNVLLSVIQQHELDADGLNVATSRNSHNVGSYNVVDTRIVTRSSCRLINYISQQPLPNSVCCSCLPPKDTEELGDQ